MRANLASRSSPLLNIEHYPTLERQGRRFARELGALAAAHCRVEAFDLNYLWRNEIDEKEKRRVIALEIFDEFESWHIKVERFKKKDVFFCISSVTISPLLTFFYSVHITLSYLARRLPLMRK
jgi:hypothetical protein